MGSRRNGGCQGAGGAGTPGLSAQAWDVRASTWQDIYIQQRELIKIEDAGPAVRQRAERDLQVALDVITSLGLSPVEEMEEAAND